MPIYADVFKWSENTEKQKLTTLLALHTAAKRKGAPCPMLLLQQLSTLDQKRGDPHQLASYTNGEGSSYCGRPHHPSRLRSLLLSRRHDSTRATFLRANLSLRTRFNPTTVPRQSYTAAKNMKKKKVYQVALPYGACRKAFRNARALPPRD